MLQGVDGVGDAAKAMRGQMSPPEVALWQALRERPGGFKFRRQHPSGPYVADFYCHAARLVIEVDGQAHDCGRRPERDAARDAWFAARGLTTLRIGAGDVLKDADAVVRQIVAMTVHRCSGEA